MLLQFHESGSLISFIIFFLSYQALAFTLCNSLASKHPEKLMLRFPQEASLSVSPSPFRAPLPRGFSQPQREALLRNFQPAPSSSQYAFTVRSAFHGAEFSEMSSSLPLTAEDPLPSLSLQSSSAPEIAEKEALLSFKASISEDPRNILSSWSSSSSSFPCNGSWAGVGCNSEGRVASLDLKASNLTGILTPFLSNLTFLTHLNLSINSFWGLIPPEFGLLAVLTHMDFKENSLTGPIPPKLGNCTALLWLDLSHNQLNGTLPPSLGKLKDLYMLQLHDIPKLTGPIPAQFGNLTNLTYLYLGSNNLIGRIPPQLGNLLKLKELYLMLNNLNGTIPPELGRLTNLEYLSIFMNQFEGSIPPHLGNLTSLKYMWCLMSQLEGTIPAELGNLRNLLELDLSLNFRLSGGIPRELGQLKDLQVLKLFQMNLSGSIPEELGNLTKLQHLYAYGNRLSGHIPPEVGHLVFLQNLQLFFNQLTGPLPVELRKLQNLQNLIIFSNSLSGKILPELGEMKSLSSLYLGDNTFTGGLPSTLGNLTNLQYFEVSPNLLRGPIPKTLGKLKNLVYIDLSKNKFTGTLPVELANCTKLWWIKMANNSLSGYIPVEFTSLPELHTLALANNKFSGSLPTAFINQSSLVVLDLQRNQFKGQLPDAWAKLENLRVLSVGYNLLQGPLPAWLYTLNRLQLLNLANNNFSGTILSKISELDGLKHNDSIVDGERNLWKDDVTLEMKGSDAYFKYLLTVVISLDLSGNALSGNIPDELSLLSGLFNLNLSHNGLTGPIPGSLGSVRTLESLDLSYNLLSGEIPPELTNLTALAFLNLSYNKLSGSIPTGNQFNSFTNQSYISNADLCGYPLTAVCGNASTQAAMAHHSSGAKVKIIAGCVSGIMTSMVMGAVVWYLVLKKKRANKAEESKVQVFDKRIDISVEELLQATSNFSDGNILGSGGSCVVYKGVLSNGMVVAIKRLDRHTEAHNSFMSELIALGQIRHRNLVKILGTLITGNYKCLILEYIPNGNLDMHLHEDPCNLSWACRFDIAVGVAHGLAYLHNETGVGQVLHCDLKPSNILLDEDFEPHISDFGIAKLITTTATKDGSISGVFRGTFGYVAPEYAYGERATAKGDVFSYGIVLLEMLTRRRPTSETLGEGTSLTLWVRSAFPENWTDVIDPALLKEMAEEKIKDEIYNVLVLALACVNRASVNRPSMRDILDAMLHLKEGKPPYKPIDQLISLATSDAYDSFIPSNAELMSASIFLKADHESSSDALLSV